MEVHYHKIRDLIGSRKDILGRFNYGGLEHCVVHRDYDLPGTPASYVYPNSLVNGVIIEFGDNVEMRFAKPVLMHEFVEWAERENHYREHPVWGRIYTEASLDLAHKKATLFDERYAKWLFDKPTFQEYLEYKARFSEFSGKVFVVY